MTESLKVSFSRLAAFKSCPLYFRRRYLQQHHVDTNLYARAGSLFHSAAEHDTNPHNPETLEAAIRHKGRNYGADVVNRALNALPAYTAFVMADTLTDVVAREYELLEHWVDDETGDRIRLHGYADRIMRGSSGLVIDDWKLGTQRPTDIAQLQTYAPIVQRQLGEPVSLLRVIYLQQNGKFKVKAFVPAMSYTDVVDLMSDMAQMLYRSGYYPGWGGLTGHCKVCPFSGSCDWVGLSSTAAIKRKAD